MPPQFLDLRDQMLDTLPLLQITKLIMEHVDFFAPTIVYTHHAGDLNLDHQIVHRAVMTACRPLPESTINEIYAFEILSSTEWGIGGFGFAPNHFVNLASAFNSKIDALLKYGDEMRPAPHARSYQAVSALARLRGAQCGVHYAEAFMTLRTIVR